MKCDFGWADLGTWHGVYESLSKREGDNVIIDSDVILEDATNNIIKLSKGKLGVINGLDDYIIAEKDNVLLICKKEDSSALVRKYVNEVQIKKGGRICIKENLPQPSKEGSSRSLVKVGNTLLSEAFLILRKIINGDMQ